MKRSGFTMIELIFVIVILGILAAVALPRFIGVSEQAQEGKIKAYVGTLNRTVAPALWSDSISQGTNGVIATAAYSTALLGQLETPEVGDTNTLLGDPDLTACTPYAAPANGTAYTDAELLGWGQVSTATLGTNVYNVKCMDGSSTGAAHFVLGVEKGGAAETLLVK